MRWLFVGLLVVPGVVLFRLQSVFGPEWVWGSVGVVSVITLWSYWWDKRQAQEGGWRTPESTLHFLACVGGWPAAFVAQQAFRHKTSKPSFQVTYWAIVAVHQYVMGDSLLGWRMSRYLASLVGM